jgi:hypothetical protein
MTKTGWMAGMNLDLDLDVDSFLWIQGPGPGPRYPAVTLIELPLASVLAALTGKE